MKAFIPFKRLISIFTAATVAASALAASLTFASAVVTVSDGVYEYTYTGSSWMLYSYSGEDTEITLPESYDGIPVSGIYSRCFVYGGVTDVVIPEGYTYIGDYAFSGCENLRSVSLPSTINQINFGAFEGSGLESVDLSQTGLNQIPAYSFMNCGSLRDVLLPQGIMAIGDSAFYGTAITSIEIPQGVTTLDRYAFYGTASLGEVTLPSTVTAIGDSCFESSGLSKINLPEGLETIGSSAFRNDSALDELYIPANVYSIGAYALFPMSIQSTINVYCFKNTYASTYCYENFVMNTTEVARVYGDSDLSGEVTISDVTLIQRFEAGILDIDNPCARALCDVNLDGEIDINDATVIQKYIAKMIDELPV